jgi:hypothetical protein
MEMAIVGNCNYIGVMRVHWQKVEGAVFKAGSSEFTLRCTERESALPKSFRVNYSYGVEA